MRNSRLLPRPLSFSLARLSSAVAVSAALALAHAASGADLFWDAGVDGWSAGINLTLVLDAAHVAPAMQRLHAAFFETPSPPAPLPGEAA